MCQISKSQFPANISQHNDMMIEQRFFFFRLTTNLEHVKPDINSAQILNVCLKQ